MAWTIGRGRLEGEAAAVDTPIGRVPAPGALDVSGLDLGADALDLLLAVDPEVWREEAALIGPHYKKFADRLPEGLWAELEALKTRLEAAAG